MSNEVGFVYHVSLSRPNDFKFFKDCLPQILPGPFLNTLPHLIVF